MDSQQLDQATKLLRATFLTNLAVLRVHMPNVYEFFRSYEPQKTRIGFDASDSVNLACEGKQIYPDSPRSSCEEQVNVFLHNPKNFRFFPQQDKPKGYEHYLQLDALDKISSLGKGYSSHEHYLNPLDVDRAPDCLCVLGAGLGYHFEAISRELDIAYLYLFEPDPDCLYAMLHVIDLRPIIDKCSSRGGFLKITVGGTAGTFVNEISSMLETQGAFNLARLLVFRHYYGEDIDKAFQLLHDIAYRYVGGWGFFEDEAISIAHTIRHVETGIPILRRPNARDKEAALPVLIIGNGPSLDKTITFIKKYENKAVIVSCGTALRSLLAKGIIPDIHVEVERTLHVYQWLSYAATPEAYEKTILIGPNTLHPKVVELFKRKYLFVKPHDAGGNLIHNTSHDRYLNLFLSSPTVSNGAAAVAVALGFTNIYLLGVDYGFRSDEYHHSKDSAYYQKEWKGQTEKMEGTIEVESSRGDKILTTSIFDMARGVMEMLLEKHENIKCYNLSDGAKITGAHFIDPGLPFEIPDDQLAGIDKYELIDDLLFSRFDPVRNEQKQVRKQFHDDYHRMEKLVRMLIDYMRGENEPHDRLSLHKTFTLQYIVLRRASQDPNLIVSYRLLKGTFCYMQTSIMSYTYTIKDPEERRVFIHQALDVFNQHLIALCQKLAERYDHLDDTSAYND